jgi:hypothetical protein
MDDYHFHCFKNSIVLRGAFSLAFSSALVILLDLRSHVKPSRELVPELRAGQSGGDYTRDYTRSLVGAIQIPHAVPATRT